jgi:hypothetical protein
MSAALERIRNDIKTLSHSEIELLYLDLQSTYDLPASDESATESEAEWDKEIAKRVKDVEEGRVELVSGEESESRIDALFAKHGLQRRTA